MLWRLSVLDTRGGLWFDSLYDLDFCVTVHQQYIDVSNQQDATTFSFINPLQTKCIPLYLKTQSVPRCKHFSSGL